MSKNSQLYKTILIPYFPRFLLSVATVTYGEKYNCTFKKKPLDLCKTKVDNY